MLAAIVRKSVTACALLTLTVSSIASAAAPDPGFTAAVASFKAGKYGPALAQFEAVAARHPKDALVHYYIALCSQNMHQMAKAKQEYEWVRDNAPQANLRTMASTGLQSIGGYKGHIGPAASTASTAPGGTGSGTSASTGGKTGTATGTTPGKDATASTDKDKDKKAEAKASKVAKVIEFTMANQRQSLVFDETFQSTKAAYPKVKFEQIEASDPSAQALLEKYGVTQYPTVVVVDAQGKSLESQYAAGMTDLGSIIDRVNGAK